MTDRFQPPDDFVPDEIDEDEAINIADEIKEDKRLFEGEN
ncbi:hypothetical protein LCGC14_0376070 [marine sediment metagenome]|uniref:Uncharacterized protein n=1 Tax=marine sediment metagenome TaxID=412755 RepID=A0A0F9T9P5_9ZZZZ